MYSSTNLILFDFSGANHKVKDASHLTAWMLAALNEKFQVNISVIKIKYKGWHFVNEASVGQ